MRVETFEVTGGGALGCPLPPWPGLALAPSPHPSGPRPLPTPLSLRVRPSGASPLRPLPSSCVHGKLSCSVEDCSRAGGGFSPWGPWGLCSRSCGGLGTRTRSRQCVYPTPAPGGQGCLGPHQDLEYCPSPDCPGEESRRGESGWLNPLQLASCPFLFLSVAVSFSASFFLSPSSSVFLFYSGTFNQHFWSSCQMHKLELG